VPGVRKGLYKFIEPANVIFCGKNGSRKSSEF
jgi:hypothetical protein